MCANSPPPALSCGAGRRPPPLSPRAGAGRPLLRPSAPPGSATLAAERGRRWRGAGTARAPARLGAGAAPPLAGVGGAVARPAAARGSARLPRVSAPERRRREAQGAAESLCCEDAWEGAPACRQPGPPSWAPAGPGTAEGRGRSHVPHLLGALHPFFCLSPLLPPSFSSISTRSPPFYVFPSLVSFSSFPISFTSLYISIFSLFTSLSPLSLFPSLYSIPSPLSLPLPAPTSSSCAGGHERAAWKASLCPRFGKGLWVGDCTLGSVSHARTHSSVLGICWQFPSPPVAGHKRFGKVYLGLGP